MKAVNRKEWEISSSSEIVDYVVKNGFMNIIQLQKGIDGKSYVKEGNKIYALIDELDWRKFELTASENILEFTELLGHFHNCAQGFVQSPGAKVRVDWGKSIEKYRTMTSSIEGYYRLISGRGRVNKFEEKTWIHLDTIISAAKATLKIFRSIGYLRALENSMMKKEICINSISDNTAVKYKKDILITGIFNLGYNMVEEDIGKLIKKGIENHGDRSIYQKVINTYSGIRQLDENSENIIRAIVTYPYNSIRMIKKYIDNQENSDILLQKFERYFECEQRFNIKGV